MGRLSKTCGRSKSSFHTACTLTEYDTSQKWTFLQAHMPCLAKKEKGLVTTNKINANEEFLYGTKWNTVNDLILFDSTQHGVTKQSLTDQHAMTLAKARSGHSERSYACPFFSPASSKMMNLERESAYWGTFHAIHAMKTVTDKSKGHFASQISTRIVIANAFNSYEKFIWKIHEWLE